MRTAAASKLIAFCAVTVVPAVKKNNTSDRALVNSFFMQQRERRCAGVTLIFVLKQGDYGQHLGITAIYCNICYVGMLPGSLSLYKQLTMPTVKLTTQDFKDNIFNYETEKEWSYKGAVPAIIDFYADWCGPCKMVAPVLEELSDEYAGKLVIYKVDTEKELELASVFGIQSIPTFLFIPVTGDPMMQPGAFPKKVFKQIIEEHLVKQPS